MNFASAAAADVWGSASQGASLVLAISNRKILEKSFFHIGLRHLSILLLLKFFRARLFIREFSKKKEVGEK
jgi:hypothetical protein